MGLSLEARIAGRRPKAIPTAEQNARPMNAQWTGTVTSKEVNAAAAVGDDRIQMEQQGYATPDSFTRGTSEQRKARFLKGSRTGDVAQGDVLSRNG